MKKINGTISLLLMCLLFGCGGERENDLIQVSEDSLDTALKESVDKHIIPTAIALTTQAKQLSESAVTFCIAPDLSQLSSIQSDWRQLSSQWYKMSGYNFGPLNDDIVFPKYTFIDSMRLRGTDYTQTIRSDITSMIMSSVELTVLYFSRLNFQKVGLLALESLIFETATGEHSKNMSHIIAEYQSTPRKCEVLVGMSQHLVKQAVYVSEGWTINYKNTGTPFRSLFLNHDLEDGSVPMSMLLVSIQSYLDYLQKRHVVTAGAQIADYGWENMIAVIDEVEILLSGTKETEVSFFHLMENAGFKNSVELVKENISRIRQSIQNKDAAALEINFGRLDGNFKREIPEALEVQLGINFSDGD